MTREEAATALDHAGELLVAWAALVGTEAEPIRLKLLEAYRQGAHALRAFGPMLEALEPDASPPGPDFLDWVAGRLVMLGEPLNADFVQALHRKAARARAALALALARKETT